MEPNSKKPKMFNKDKFKPNKKKYFQSKKQFLQAGQRGFFVTCNINEKGCVRECYNLLNHYADILYGPEEDAAVKKKPEQVDAAATETATEPKTVNGSDSDDDLDALIAKCRETRKTRFQSVDTGTNNCIFIRTQLEDPVSLGKHIVNDISSTRKAMSRFIMRMVPIEAVCRANVPDIINAAGPLFDKHFLKQPSTYGIIFNRRYNQQVKREDVIPQLAELVNSKNLENKVDLKEAKKSIIVEVLRGWCLLSVIDNYLEYKKFNLAELAYPTEKPEMAENAGKTDAATKSPEKLKEVTIDSTATKEQTADTPVTAN